MCSSKLVAPVDGLVVEDAATQVLFHLSVPLTLALLVVAEDNLRLETRQLEGNLLRHGKLVLEIIMMMKLIEVIIVIILNSNNNNNQNNK